MEAWCASCGICWRQKARKGLSPPTQALELTAVGERLHLDLVGPFPTTVRGNRYVLSTIDAASKYVILVPIRDKSAKSVADALVKHVYLVTGFPDEIVTDQGGEWVNRLNKELNAAVGIQHRTTSPYHPAGNGKVERMHRDLGVALRAVTDPDGARWDLDIPFVAWALNTTWSRVTGETPFFLTYGRHPRTIIDALVGTSTQVLRSAEWMDTLFRARRLAAARAGLARGVTPPEQRVPAEEEPVEALRKGQLVLVKFTGGGARAGKKLRPKQQGPYRVVSVRDGVTAVLEHISNPKDRLERTAQHLVPFTGELDHELDDEWEVDAIIDEKVIDGETQFLVAWLGFPEDRATWVSATALEHAPEAMTQWQKAKNTVSKDRFRVQRVVQQRGGRRQREYLCALHEEDGPEDYRWLDASQVQNGGLLLAFDRQSANEEQESSKLPSVPAGGGVGREKPGTEPSTGRSQRAKRDRGARSKKDVSSKKDIRGKGADSAPTRR